MLKSSNASLPRQRRRPCADAGFHTGTGRTARLPDAWRANNNARGFEFGRSARKRWASSGVQRSGWYISPASTMS